MKRIARQALLAAIVLYCAVWPAAAENFPSMYFAEVREVGPRDVRLVEAIKLSKPDGLVYAMLHSDETFTTADGSVGGFSRFVCEHLSQLLGIPVTPRIVGWDDLTQGLDSHEFDLSGELTATPERRKKYRFTTPIAERAFTVYRRADLPELDLINGRELRRLGFLEDSITFTRVQDTAEIAFAPIFFRNYLDAASAIRQGAIDAFITESMMDSAFEGYAGIAYQKYYPLAYTTVSLCTANPDLHPLIDVLQKYLDDGGTERLMDLYIQGNREYLRHKLFRQLSGEEKEFIRRKQEADAAIPVAAEFDNYPASFFNVQDNEWQGVAHDVLREIAGLTGLRFAIVSRPDEEWSSVLAKLERGAAHIVTHLARSKARRGRFLWPPTPYMRDQYALLSCSETEDIPINRVRNTRVGLIRGTAYEEAFHRVFPEHDNVRLYPDTIAAFGALPEGDVRLLMMTRNLMLSATNYMEQPDFKINVPIELPCNSYFGLHKDQAVLAGILGKAQTIIDSDTIADRWKRKVFDYRKKIAEARIPYFVSMCLLLLSILGLVVLLFQSRVHQSDARSMTDHLTQLPNRRSFDAYLRRQWKRAVSDRLQLSLLMIDVDHFKDFNDNYGHHQGDVILQRIGVVLAGLLKRTNDFAARYGGEEFAVILPNTDNEGALYVAETIREAVEALRVEKEDSGEILRVTVSIGVAAAKPVPGHSIQMLFDRSDKTLYLAKSRGRNRVCCAEGMPA